MRRPFWCISFVIRKLLYAQLRGQAHCSLTSHLMSSPVAGALCVSQRPQGRHHHVCDHVARILPNISMSTEHHFASRSQIRIPKSSTLMRPVSFIDGIARQGDAVVPSWENSRLTMRSGRNRVSSSSCNRRVRGALRFARERNSSQYKGHENRGRSASCLTRTFTTHTADPVLYRLNNGSQL